MTGWERTVSVSWPLAIRGRNDFQMRPLSCGRGTWESSTWWGTTAKTVWVLFPTLND